MTDTKRLMTIEELLQEQRTIENLIDVLQRQLSQKLAPITTEQNLKHYQERLKEVQEELKECKKNAQ